MNKKCCGFQELPDGSCQLFEKCEPLKPNYASTYHRKTAGGEEKKRWQMSVKADGLSGDEVVDVPWLACETGLYKTAEGKLVQCGVAEITNPNGGRFVEVPYWKKFPGTPVVISFAMSRIGKVT